MGQSADQDRHGRAQEGPEVLRVDVHIRKQPQEGADEDSDYLEDLIELSSSGCFHHDKPFCQHVVEQLAYLGLSVLGQDLPQVLVFQVPVAFNRGDGQL